MRHRSALLLVLLVAACASTSNKATTRVTVANIDADRAMRDCREGRAARADLMEIHRRDQAALDGGQELLIRQIAEIKALRAQGVDVRAREAALAQDMAALEGQYVQLQRDLSAEEQRRARPIREHLRVILRRLAQSRGIETVAEQPPVVAGDPAYVDLTDDVIRAAEAQ